MYLCHLGLDTGSCSSGIGEWIHALLPECAELQEKRVSRGTGVACVDESESSISAYLEVIDKVGTSQVKV